MKYIFRLIAIVASFALLFAAYGGRVDPNIWTLPSLATLALPAVAVAVLALLVLLVLFRQWRAAVVLVGAICLSWPTLRLISPVNLWGPKEDPDEVHLKVMTMNVTEFNWQEKTSEPSKNMRYILDEDADIVVIQEGLVYYSYEQQDRIKPMLEELYKKYPYRKKHFFDVGILSKYPFTEVQSPVLAQDSLGYFIKAWDVEAPGGDIRVMSMHLSSLRLNKNERGVIESMNLPSGRKRRIQSVTRKLDVGFISHARQADAGRVNLRAGAHERVAAHDRRDRMVRPLVPDGFSDLRNGTAPAGRSRPFVTRMRLAVALALRDGAARVHRDRGVPAVVPRLHPLGEGRAAAAVHEHHGRHLAVRARAFGKTPPREDARRPPLQRLAFDEDRLDARDPPVIVRAGDCPGERARGLVQGLDVPERTAAARQLALRPPRQDEQSAQGCDSGDRSLRHFGCPFNSAITRFMTSG